jgi:hypothetical protein
VKVDELLVIKLLNRAKAAAGDSSEVNRLLREVGKFLDPLTGRAMVEGVARARVIDLLERDERAEALAMIDGFIERYQKRLEPASSPGCSGDQGEPACKA